MGSFFGFGFKSIMYIQLKFLLLSHKSIVRRHTHKKGHADTHFSRCLAIIPCKTKSLLLQPVKYTY